MPTPRTGVHDFDFQFGDWRVHHRVKRPGSGDEWSTFEGTCSARPILGGSGNVEDNTFMGPSGVTQGVALRAYDPASSTWAIWWVDSRDPHGPLDPPLKGRFEKGVGVFYSDGIIDGKPLRTRFVWSQVTQTRAHWEQAYSFDDGETWQTNWVMNFSRVQ